MASGCTAVDWTLDIRCVRISDSATFDSLESHRRSALFSPDELVRVNSDAYHFLHWQLLGARRHRLWMDSRVSSTRSSAIQKGICAAVALSGRVLAIATSFGDLYCADDRGRRNTALCFASDTRCGSPSY